MNNLTCPRCGANLVQSGSQHSCPACRGVFIERAIIAGILDAVRTGLASGSTGSPYRSAPAARKPSSTTARYLLCPICAKHMNRTRLVEKLDLVAQYAQSETRGVAEQGEPGGAEGREGANADDRLALVLDFFFKRQGR